MYSLLLVSGPSKRLHHQLPSPAAATRCSGVLGIKRTHMPSQLCPFQAFSPSLHSHCMPLLLHHTLSLPSTPSQVLTPLLSPPNPLYTRSLTWHNFSGVHLGSGWPKVPSRYMIFHNTCSSSTWKAEAGGLPWVGGQLSLHNKFQASIIHKMRPCLESSSNANTTTYVSQQMILQAEIKMRSHEEDNTKPYTKT